MLSAKVCNPYLESDAALVEGYFALRQKIFTGPRGKRTQFDITLDTDKPSDYIIASIGDKVAGGVRITESSDLASLAQLQLMAKNPNARAKFDLLQQKKAFLVDHAIIDTEPNAQNIGGYAVFGALFRKVLEYGKEHNTQIIFFAPDVKLMHAVQHAQKTYHFAMADFGEITVPNVEGVPLHKHMLGVVLNESLAEKLIQGGTPLIR